MKTKHKRCLLRNIFSHVHSWRRTHWPTLSWSNSIGCPLKGSKIYSSGWVDLQGLQHNPVTWCGFEIIINAIHSSDNGCALMGNEKKSMRIRWRLSTRSNEIDDIPNEESTLWFLPSHKTHQSFLGYGYNNVPSSSPIMSMYGPGTYRIQHISHFWPMSGITAAKFQVPRRYDRAGYI